jgi:hypothetical protein
VTNSQGTIWQATGALFAAAPTASAPPITPIQ